MSTGRPVRDRGPTCVGDHAGRAVQQVLREAGIGGWLPNFPVVAGNRVLATVGAAFPDRLLAIRVECVRFDPTRLDEDADHRLAAAGWVVLRFTWNDVIGHPERVVSVVRAQLETRSDLSST